MAADQKKNCFSASSIVASVPLDNMAWMLKQKNNAYYHIQAINLPFQNIEFYYLDKEFKHE